MVRTSLVPPSRSGRATSNVVVLPDSVAAHLACIIPMN